MERREKERVREAGGRRVPREAEKRSNDLRESRRSRER